jgi:hypothetical protein
MALAPVEPKKKKPQTAADQANAVDNTVLGAEQGTSAQKPKTVEDLVKASDRAKGQAVVDADKFTPKPSVSVMDTVKAGYEFGLGTGPQVKALEKQGLSAAQIAAKLGLKPKVK